jgi:mannose-1-phosphate guanylyltransferase
MKAMILAAGKGTRVRPLTYDLPKPMIPILGKPVMAYLVEHLARYGITEIMVNVSYLHEKIEEYFGEGHQFGVQIGYSFEGYTNNEGEVVPEPLGSAGGIKKIQEFGGFFDDTTIVLCGDAIIDLDIKSALFEHRRKGALASVITREVPWDKVPSYGVVVTDADGRIRAFQEKPRQEEALSTVRLTSAPNCFPCWRKKDCLSSRSSASSTGSTSAASRITGKCCKACCWVKWKT